MSNLSLGPDFTTDDWKSQYLKNKYVRKLILNAGSRQHKYGRDDLDYVPVRDDLGDLNDPNSSMRDYI